MSSFSKFKKALKLLYDKDYSWIFLAGQCKNDSLDDEKYIKNFERAK